MSAIMKPAEAAEYLGVSPETLTWWCYMDRGQLSVGGTINGPKWVDGPSGRRRIGYLQAELDKWLNRELAA